MKKIIILSLVAVSLQAKINVPIIEDMKSAFKATKETVEHQFKKGTTHWKKVADEDVKKFKYYSKEVKSQAKNGSDYQITAYDLQ